jgi:anti-sigma B factor antagonist
MHEPSLSIRVADESTDRPVIYVAGEVDLATCGQLRDVIEALMVEHSIITVDIVAVTFMDSSCLNVFAQTHRTISSHGGSFNLRNASETARRLLTLTGLEFLLADTTESHPR